MLGIFSAAEIEYLASSISPHKAADFTARERGLIQLWVEGQF
jgi:hypothetical protein